MRIRAALMPRGSPGCRKHMYFPYFVTYMSIGLVLSIVVFIWALKNHQFRDQQRARYLPLEDEHGP